MARTVQFACLAILMAVLALPGLASNDDDFQKGVRAFQGADYGAAVKAFEAAVREAPDDALCRLWLGLSYHRLGQLGPARAALREAARLGGQSEVGVQARQNLEALDRASAPAQANRTPTGWRRVGAVQGLLGDDWNVRDTRNCRAWARQGDLRYLEEVVATLDQAYEINSRFMGFRIQVPLEFYFFTLAQPAHMQPRFAAEIQGRTRFAGLAFGPKECLVNLGNWRNSQHYEPWDVAVTACHEMNHMFLFGLGTETTSGDWTWLAEALAESVEDRVLPASRQSNLQTMKLALQGYRSPDSGWRSLVADRNADDLEQFREYGKILASIIYFFQARYGQDAVPRLLKAARSGPLSEAFREAFGRDVASLHAEWKAFYGIR